MKAKVKNILFTCAGGSSPIFFARELKKSHGIFLVDGGDQNAAPHLGFPFQKIPFGTDPAFPGVIKALIEKWNIDCVVPGTNKELEPLIQVLKENPSLLMVMPSADFINLCLNKKKLMEELATAGISFLSPYAKKETVHYPAIVKPIYGEGSRQFHIIKTALQLEGYLGLYEKEFNDVLVQPYIEGTEYTISVIVNNLNKIIGVVPKKIIEKRGITRAAVSEQNELIHKLCEDIVTKYNPRGPFNVQLKLWEGKAYIFEINPRLSTTSVLSDKAFGNEVELYLKYYDADEIKDPPELKSGVYLYRYEENIFVS
jgi:carbamoyl-phosphate synthase large subunit